MPKMTFGRHRGVDTSEVSTDYLLWAASSMSPVPQCVTAEIDRRSRMGGRHAALLQEAVANAWLAKAKSQRKQAKRQRGGRKKSKPGQAHTGERFGQARAAWLAGGGDTGGRPW